MAAQFFGDEVALTGATFKEVVGAPASSTRRQILSLWIHNRDTVDHTFQSRKVVGASNFLMLTITVKSGQAGNLMPVGCSVLDGTNESYEVKSDATAATTEPLVDVAYFQEP